MVSSLQEAQRKARFGHRDWISWTARDGSKRYERCSAVTVKEALLASGTKGKWYFVAANDGTIMRGFWWMGINLLRNEYHAW